MCSDLGNKSNPLPLQHLVLFFQVGLCCGHLRPGYGGFLPHKQGAIVLNRIIFSFSLTGTVCKIRHRD
jgi:hypothetical protein